MIWVRVLIAMLVMSQAPLAGAQPAAQSAEPRERLPAFHRLFLPEREIERRAWQQRYLPVEATEFERDLKIVADHRRGAPTTDVPRLENAKFTAQLIGDDLLVGTAQYSFSGDYKEPRLLPLGVSSFAIESARWPQSDSPATIALDASGNLQLLVVERRLDMRWSQRGQRTASGAVQFGLELPPSLVGTLEVTVPVGAEIVSDEGIVTRPAELSEDTAATASRWLIELGGASSLRLRVVPRESAGQRRPLTLLRQATTYEFSTRGIMVGTQLRLDVHGEPLERLKIDLDPTLHLISAKVGELPIPWSSATDVETGDTHLILELQEPLFGPGRVIQLSSVTPLITDETLSLPRVLPQQVAWQEGTASLLIPASLVLEQLKTTGCRQSRVTALPAPLTGESIEIQFYRPDALIEARVAEPRQKLTLSAGHLVEVGPDTIRTVSTFEFSGGNQPTRVVELPLRPGWIVDSVQGEKDSEPLDWDLAEAVSPARLQMKLPSTGRILIHAHTQLTAQRPLPALELRAFNLDSLDVIKELISIQGTGGFEVRWQGDVHEGRQPDSLTTDELSLFHQVPKQFVTPVDDRLDGTTVTLERQQPQFTADLHVDVAVQGQSLTETFTVFCTPAASRIDRILIQLSQKRDENVKWSLAGGNTSGTFSARRLTEGEQTKLGLAQGEVWELLLEMDRQGKFEFRGQRTRPFSAETAIALASVPEASSQRGTLSVRALGNIGLQIKNQGLLSVPAETLDDDHYQTARAAYHYQPLSDDFATQATITLAPSQPLQAQTGAWLWNLKLITRFDSDGLMTHTAIAEIETAGRRHLDVKLPTGATLINVRIDDQQIDRPEPVKQAKTIAIELPAGKSRSRLTIHYSTEATLPTLVGKFTPPFPILNVPYIHREWQLWLPPDHLVGDLSGCLPSLQMFPRTWSERLFGLLGRGADEHLFNPLVAADWSDAFAVQTSAGLAQDRVRQCIANLGNVLIQYQDAEDLTWGQLLSTVSELQDATNVRLLVDDAALAAVNIGPSSRLVASELADISPELRGKKLLENSRLIVIAITDRVLLTSVSLAAGYDPQFLTRVGGEPAGVAHGVLEAALETAPKEGATIQPVPTWLATARAPSPNAVRATSRSTDPAGWRRYDIPCPENAKNYLRIVHSARMRSLAWAALLGSVGFCLWRPRLGPRIMLVVLSSLGAVALLVPPSYSPLASAALLGVLVGLLFRMTATSASNTRTNPSVASRASQSKFAKPIVTALFLAALVNVAAALDAAEIDESLDSQLGAKPLYTVLFPIDEQQNPSGTKVFVPEPLYEALLRESAAAGGHPRGWLITQAEYEGMASREPSGGVSVAAIKASFTIDVFQSNLSVRLPFPQESWRQVVTAVRLDGKNFKLGAQAEQGLPLGPLSFGRHMVEFDLRPKLMNDVRTTGIDLPIPRVAQSTLRLNGTGDLATIRVASAQGRVTVDAERASLIAQLGAVDRLTIRWPTAPINTGPAATANFQVEELLWVRVRPGTTVLDSRLKFQVSSGELRTIRIATDPRLRLLTSPASGSLVSAVRTFPGSPQIVELDLAQPVRDAITLDLSFLVADASGVGNLRLPQLESLDARPSRRWLGVSVDPALQYRIQAGEDSPSVEIAKFLEVWGIGDAKPLAAYAISRGEPIWFLATQPAEPKIKSQQKTILSIGRHSAQARFEATLDITAGVVAQLLVNCPRGFKPDRVAVFDQDVERVARWSASDDGELSVFLTTPISGRQQLIISGRWPLPEAMNFEAPSWSVQSAEVHLAQWEFYRQSDILLTVSSPPEARQVEPSVQVVRTARDALAAAFQADQANLNISLQVTPNEPRVEVASVTSLRRDGDRFLAYVDIQLEVAGGVLDALQLEVPLQFVEPFRAEPAATVSLATATATQQRVLTIIPTVPWAGRQLIRLQGRIAPALGDGLKIPDLRPLAVGAIDRYVALPKQLDSQPVSWEISHLTPAKLPAALLPRDWKTETVQTYRIQDDSFQATLKSVDRPNANAVIQLADIQLVCLPGGCCTAATYDLVPGGANDCELRLPAGCELIHASVERLPASLVELGGGKYRINLGAQNLPQRIELLYTLASARSPDNVLSIAPRLGNIEPLQTLWTIYHLPQDRVLPSERRFGVSASDQLLARLLNTSRLVDLSADVLGEHLPDEIARWYVNWRERYWNDRLRLRRTLITAARDLVNSEEAGEARGLDQKMIALDARLGVKDASGLTASAHDFVESFVAAAGNGLIAQHFSLKKSDGEPKIYYVVGADDLPWRWLSASGLLLMGCLAGWRLKRSELPRFSPLAVACAVALFWWLFLGASMWGLLAISVIVLALVWIRNRSD